MNAPPYASLCPPLAFGLTRGALPLPSALLTLLQYCHKTIAQYATPTRPPWCMPYTIQYWQLRYRVQAKSASAATFESAPLPKSVTFKAPTEDLSLDSVCMKTDCCRLRRRRALSTEGHSAF